MIDIRELTSDLDFANLVYHDYLRRRFRCLRLAFAAALCAFFKAALLLAVKTYLAILELTSDLISLL